MSDVKGLSAMLAKQLDVAFAHSPKMGRAKTSESEVLPDDGTAAEGPSHWQYLGEAMIDVLFPR
jgi:hypothetical protein